jgi:hypothetical protein
MIYKLIIQMASIRNHKQFIVRLWPVVQKGLPRPPTPVRASPSGPAASRHPAASRRAAMAAPASPYETASVPSSGVAKKKKKIASAAQQVLSTFSAPSRAPSLVIYGFGQGLIAKPCKNEYCTGNLCRQRLPVVLIQITVTLF